MRRGERPLGSLPMPLLAGFVLLLGAQVAYHQANDVSLQHEYSELGPPLDDKTYRALAMGSERLFAYLLAIRLQLHDSQAGRHWSYNRLDYSRLVSWLDTVTSMDRDSEYPLLMASRIYAQTTDAERLRKIIGFIDRGFEQNPQLHWRRLAEACLLARHKLNDLSLALELARKLAAQPARVRMPRWARDFEFLLLANLGELESAIVIIEALLASNSIDDPDEARFLRGKLSEFRQQLSDTRQNGPENIKK